MGLDYTLEFSTKLDAAQALSLIAEHIRGLSWGDDRKYLWNKDITITAIPLGRESQSITEESFGFTPDISVGFRFPSNEDYDHFARLMLDGTLLLLQHAGDAVLLFSMETIVLQRIGGQLVFNADSSVWDDESWLRKHVGIPLERRPLPSPLL